LQFVAPGETKPHLLFLGFGGRGFFLFEDGSSGGDAVALFETE
jgi:hypothetical protein